MIKVVVDTNGFISSFLAEIPEKLLIYGKLIKIRMTTSLSNAPWH